MGIINNHVRFRKYVNGEWGHWVDAACFGGGAHMVRGHKWEYEVRPVAKEKVSLRYLDELLKCMPGLCKRVSDYVFAFPATRTCELLKRFALATLIRNIEEFDEHVYEWEEIVDRGIPTDVAFLCCSNGSRYPGSHSGHSFGCSLARLKTLKDFTLQKDFVDLCTNETGEIHSTLLSGRCFGFKANYPSSFRLTRKIYDAFCDDNVTVQERNNLIAAEARNPYGKYEAIG